MSKESKGEVAKSPVTFEDLQRLAQSDVFDYDALIAAEIDKIFRREDFRRRLAAFVMARRRIKMIEDAGAKIQTLEGRLFAEDRVSFMRTEQLIAAIRVFSTRQVALMGLDERSEEPPIMTPNDYLAATGHKVNPPTAPVEDATARHILAALQRVGESVANRRLGKVSPPPVFLPETPPKMKRRRRK